MMYEVLPETIKLNKITRELKDLAAWKTVPDYRIWVTQNVLGRDGQRWFDQFFRPARRLFWNSKTMSM